MADETRKGYLLLNHFHGLRLESDDFETDFGNWTNVPVPGMAGTIVTENLDRNLVAEGKHGAGFLAHESRH